MARSEIYIPGLSGSQCFSKITLKLCLSSRPTASDTVSSMSLTLLLRSIFLYRSPDFEVFSSTWSKKMTNLSSYGMFWSSLMKLTRPSF